MGLRRWVHPNRLSRYVAEVVHRPRQQLEPVVVPDAQGGHEGKVVDAGDDRIDVVHRGVEDQAQPELETDQLVAEAYGLDRRRLWSPLGTAR